jgi:hypothetical protein
MFHDLALRAKGYFIQSARCVYSIEVLRLFFQPEGFRFCLEQL